MTTRLEQQLQFLHEIDKLKTIVRCSNLISEPDRLENTAEHSWHVGMYASILAEYSNEEIDVPRVVRMLLIHDIVEVDAGDTFAYDEVGKQSKVEREQRAADRIFGLLPSDQQSEFRALWDEFEEGTTADAKFAISIDRIQPLLHNYLTGGGGWKRNNVVHAQVEKYMSAVGEGSSELGDLVTRVLNDAVDKTILATNKIFTSPLVGYPVYVSLSNKKPSTIE